MPGAFMIRRDFILRMIEEFARVMNRVDSLKKNHRWEEAGDALDAGFNKLAGAGAEEVAKLSEIELLARVMEDGPTHGVREKTLILAALLNEAGEVAVAQGRLEAGRECHLKALHLLLEILGGQDVFECPEFVPTVEAVVIALQDGPLPPLTAARLMQHYERTGEFGKAEDMLHTLREADPGAEEMREFGVQFYRRLLERSDEELVAGNLPRAEVEEGLGELHGRKRKK
ncbi:MAG TPA: DUF6483 family protein [Verrucomicrobiae bacterium]|nr:DUF6483 family protein [Verrucomicrobiae bacterium]